MADDSTVDAYAAEATNWDQSRPIFSFFMELTNRKSEGPEVALSIVRHPSCGLEKRSCVEDFEALDFLPGAPGKTPLLLAAEVARVDVLAALLANGANINARDDLKVSALHFAAGNSNPACLKLLLAEGATVDIRSEDQATPLHFAAASGRRDNAQVLLDHGADIHAMDSFVIVPLVDAIREGHTETAQALKDEGGSV